MAFSSYVSVFTINVAKTYFTLLLRKMITDKLRCHIFVSVGKELTAANAFVGIYSVDALADIIFLCIFVEMSFKSRSYKRQLPSLDPSLAIRLTGCVYSCVFRERSFWPAPLPNPSSCGCSVEDGMDERIKTRI